MDSTSEWASPAVLVPKKNGDGEFELCFCTDYRKINNITKGNAYPIPRITSILEGMRGYFYSSLDLFMGYYQLELTPRARERSAFVTEDGLYEFTRMPFGMSGAPATFQNMMNTIFEDMIGKVLYVYLDDTTNYTRTFEEHMAVLREVLRRLSNNGLFLKAKKCTLAAPSIELLGHVVDKDGVRTAPSKIKAMITYPSPTDRGAVRAAMGTFNYYRSFIKDFSKIAAPINATL